MADVPISSRPNYIIECMGTPTKKIFAGGGMYPTTTVSVEDSPEKIYAQYECNWQNGSWAFSSNNPGRGDRIFICQDWLYIWGVNGKRYRERQWTGVYFDPDIRSDTWTWPQYRQEFYPVSLVHYCRDHHYYRSYMPTANDPILGIIFKVFPANRFAPSEGQGQSYREVMYAFSLPDPPKQTIDYDEDTKELSFKVSSSIDFTDTSSHQERYRTEFAQFQRITSISGKRVVENYTKSKINSGKDLLKKEYTFDTVDGIFPNGKNAIVRDRLTTETDYILYRLNSFNRGICGAGPNAIDFYRQTDTDVENAYVIAIPPKATIASVKKVGEYVQVRLKNTVRNSVPSEIRNFDTPPILVELEKTEATLDEFRQNASNLSWSSVANAKGSADSVVFQESIAEAQTVERGKYTYYRIKTTRGDMAPNYSEPMRSELFHKEPLSAVGSKISIAGWRLSKDGNSVALDLVWGIDDADQVEITYAKDPNAWANYDPSDTDQTLLNVMVVDTDKESDQYKDNAGTFTVTGLRTDINDKPDLRPWYFRVRRKREENESYGHYNNFESGTLTQIVPLSYLDSVPCRILGMARDNKKDIVTVYAAWDESDSQKLEGTQFQWSTTDSLEENSTSEPSTYDVDDNDSNRVDQAVSLNIHDIDGGNTLYVRTRRYAYDDLTGEKTYGAIYSNEVSLAITAEDDIVSIIDIIENGDGESLQIRLGWGEDDSDGTEISWSKKAYAWESSTAPSTFNVDWDGQLSDDPNYKYETTASIDGLEVGETYYIRARRYQEGTQNTFGSYTDTLQAIPYSKPKDVVANTSEYHPRGKDLELSWTFTSESEQTAYVIQSCVDDGSEMDAYTKADVIDSQNSDVNGIAIPANLVEQYTVDGILRMIVTVATGGGSADSNMLVVNVVDAPTCEIEMSDPDAIVDSIKNVKFKIASPKEDNTFQIQLIAHGAALSLPDDAIIQSYGDVLWSGSVDGKDLEWEDGVAEYTLPETLSGSGVYLIENGEYELKVFAHDPFSDLTMVEPATTQFRVSFQEYPELYDQDTSIEIDEDAFSATIYPKLIEEAPEGTEIYLYRHGMKNDTQIAFGNLDGIEVSDPYIPFGTDADLYYVFMIKTPDGNIQTYRYMYKFTKNLMRIDWGDGESVELPFNLNPSDTYTKDFEKRTYLDGSENGYWGPGVSHTGTVTSAVFKVRDETDLTAPERERQRHILNKLRELRVHNGSAFIRTPDGAGFEANVNVKKLDPKYDSLLYDISIEFTEIDTTSNFLANVVNNVSDEEEPTEPELEPTE